MRLFIFEFKRIIKSLVFWLTVIILIFAVQMQIGHDFEIKEPQPGEQNYGSKTTNDLSVIYPNLVMDLIQSTVNNNLTTYPYGFYKNKTLNHDELKLMKKMIEELTSKKYEDIINFQDHSEFIDSPNSSKQPLPQEFPKFDIAKIPERQALESSLEKIDSLLGGGSFYSPGTMEFHFGKIGMNYDDAIVEYRLMQQSGIDYAFARYFNDYTGIFISLLVWFLPIAIWLKDNKKGVGSTINVKSVSTSKMFFARISAIVFSLLLAIIIFYSYYEFRVFSLHGIENMHVEKTYGLLIIWLLPIIMFGTAMSSFLTILTNNVLAAIVGPLSVIIVNIRGSSALVGDMGWSLVIRHNTIGAEQYFADNIKQFLMNRILWMSISVLILLVSCFILNLKRGSMNGNKNIRSK